MDNSGWGVLILAGVGLAYLIGRSGGQKSGYNQAQVETQRWVRVVSDQNAEIRSQYVALSQQYGALQTENAVLKDLLHQQPRTPEAEAITKAIERVEFRLDQFLPPIYRSSTDPDTSVN